MIPPIRYCYDVVIAGARVAGASTAMLLARQGLRVLVVDPLARGTDTLSTHALMRAGVLQLHRWGVLDAVRAAGTPRIETTTFHYGGESITLPIKARDGIDCLYAPRRTVLDSILVDAAREAGAHVVHGVAVIGLVNDRDGRVRGVTVTSPATGPLTIGADLVIGADGLRSRVARLTGADTIHRTEHATASIYGYVSGLELTGYEWYFEQDRAIGAIPTNDGDTCVFASLPPARLRAERARGLDVIYGEIVRAVDPGLADHMDSVDPAPRLRAFAGAHGMLRRSHGPGWALVGDAGYFKDPLTAHGITDALRDAELLARAVDEGAEDALARYQAARDGLAHGMMAVTDEIASLGWTLDEVKELHLELSRVMSAEVDMMLEWDRVPVEV